jgi:hypothetical protein
MPFVHYGGALLQLFSKAYMGTAALRPLSKSIQHSFGLASWGYDIMENVFQSHSIRQNFI